MIGNIRRWIANHPNEVLLFCVSFFVHLVASIFLYAKFGESVLWFENEDAHGYLEIARSVAAGEGFIHNGVVSAVRTPAYPLLLAPLFLLRLPMPWTILLLQNIIASAAAVFLFRTGKTLFSERVGFIAGLMYALEPYMIMTANLATTETVFNFIIIAFAYVFGRWYLGQGKRSDFFLSALILGIATLTRPVTKFFPLVVLILLAIKFIREKRLSAWFKHAAIFFALYLAVLTPWSLRQYARFDTLRLTNIDANMMYFRIAPILVSAEQNIDYVAAIVRLKERLTARYPEYTVQESFTFAYYDFMMEETIRLIAANPVTTARYFSLSLIPGLTGTGYEYMLEEVFGVERRTTRVSFTQLLFNKDFRAYAAALMRMDVLQVALLGGAATWAMCYILIFWAFSRRVTWQERLPQMLFLVFSIGYFIFFSLGPQAHARYRMPSFPFLYLLIAYAVSLLYDSHLRRHSRIQ